MPAVTQKHTHKHTSHKHVSRRGLKIMYINYIENNINDDVLSL